VDREQRANLDPTTGEPVAHPVGTGVGAATGGTVGAVIGGAVGGPLGAMVGAAVGGIAGGLAGKGISESVSPTEEDVFWRDHYSSRPYASGRRYEDLQPAYRFGWEARTRYEDRNWNEVEGDLERDWIARSGSKGLAWNDARQAVRDAWDRIEARYRFLHPEETGYSYEDYRPAYWYGWEASQRYRGKPWEAVANELEQGWPEVKGDSKLSWTKARQAVYDAWSRGASLEPSTRNRKAVQVPLEELHDNNGRLHAGRFAEYLNIPLKQFAEALGKNYSTVHRTPSALDLQATLRSIKRSLVILEEVLRDRSRVLAWLNHPHPDLGRQTPMEVILKGRAQIVEDMLEAAVEGIPS
jgi:hypothetical protein